MNASINTSNEVFTCHSLSSSSELSIYQHLAGSKTPENLDKTVPLWLVVGVSLPNDIEIAKLS